MPDTPIESLVASDPPDPLAPTEAERARIRELLKKVKPSALKYLSASLPNSESAQTNFYDILAEHLDSTADKHWRERTVAAWGMGFANISGDNRKKAVSALRDLLSNRHQVRHKLYRERVTAAFMHTFKLIYGIGIAGVILALISDPRSFFAPDLLLKLGKFLGTMIGIAAFGSCYFLPATIPISVISSNDHNNEARAMAAKSLLRQNALEALPELLAGAVEKSEAVQKECREALHHFLPQIVEANSDLMPMNSEALLSHIIVTTYDIEYGAVIVNYLGKFGRGSSLDAVTKHLRELCSDYSGSKTELEKYKAKVQNVLALLRERQNQENTRQELLRCSTAPVIYADQLLRPAADSQTAPAEQLLRASTGTD